MLSVDMNNEFGDNFRIRFRLELVTLLLQEFLNILVVGYDPCYEKSIPIKPAKVQTTGAQIMTITPKHN